MTAVNYINILRGHAVLHAVQSLGKFRIGLTTGTFGSLLLILQGKTMLWPDSYAWEIDAFSSSWAHLILSQPSVVRSSSCCRSSDGNSSLLDEGGSASQVPQPSVQLAGYGSVVWPDSLSEWLVDGAGLQ